MCYKETQEGTGVTAQTTAGNPKRHTPRRRACQSQTTTWIPTVHSSTRIAVNVMHRLPDSTPQQASLRLRFVVRHCLSVLDDFGVAWYDALLFIFLFANTESRIHCSPLWGSMVFVLVLYNLGLERAETLTKATVRQDSRHPQSRKCHNCTKTFITKTSRG